MNRFFYISPFILQTLVWPITRAVFWFFLHLKVEGLGNLKSLPEGRGVIFAANHSSELDPILIPASLPFFSPLMPIFYASREPDFYKNSGWKKIFYGGLFFKLWGSHKLDSGKHNYEISLRTHIQILKSGHSLCMFPDGKKLSENQIGIIAHGGASFIAWLTKGLIVPVRINGANNTTFTDFVFRRRTVKIVFGQPLYFENLSLDKNPVITEFKNSSRQIMEKVLEL